MAISKPINELSVSEVEEELRELKLREEQLLLRRAQLSEQTAANRVEKLRPGFSPRNGFGSLLGVSSSTRWDPDPT